MKKLLIPFILLFSVQSYAQICADEDTVRSITSSLVTYNSARVNGTVSHFSGSVTGLNLRYVRVGHTDTATATGSFSSALRNLTGLVSNTQYIYYYQTVCGSGTNRNLGTYTFTTQSNSIVYTDERPTKFNYIKIDSGFILPRTDTSIYRQPNYAGAMVMKGTIPYYYNGTSWSAFSGGNDSAYVNGVAVNDTTLRLYRDNGDSSDYILRGAAAVLGAGTVTQINQGFGMELTPSPITVTGYVAVDSNAIKALSGWGSGVTLTSSGLLIGNSTTAEYHGYNGVEYYLMSGCDSLLGTTVTDIAVPGNTILQQQTAFLADTNKGNYDWIIVDVGLNDLIYSESAVTALARYQNLIDSINLYKKSTAVVIVSAMTPCKARMIVLYGGTNGLISYQKWLDMNAAIMGNGTNKITGVTYRIDNASIALNDGDGNLAVPYNSEDDGIHENNLGRQIIAGAYRNILNNIGFLTCGNPLPVYPPSPLVSTQIMFGNAQGLATSSPLLRWQPIYSTLDITGFVRLRDGSQGVNKVLTSDADGIATWSINGANLTLSTSATTDTTTYKPLVVDGSGNQKRSTYWYGGSGGGSMVYPGAGIPLSTGAAWGTSITDNSANWNTAYTQTRQWDGGSTGLTAATGRTSLGGTTVGQNMFTLTNPSAITFPRFNADNTVTALSAASMLTALGAQASGTYVTAVSVATANGVSGSSSGGATPALTISLGAITPTSVNSVVVSGSATPTLAVTGTSSISGANTGDNSANSTYASDYRAANFIAGTNYQVPITAGDVTTSGATATIGAGKVTLAMQANMATASLVYRKTAGSGAPEVNTLATLKTDLAITKSDVGLGSVENTALSTWAGTANITTLGTIATGTWQGSIVAPAYLGTGASITTKFLRGDGTWQTLAGGGDMLSTNNLSDVANVTTSRNNILPSKTGNSLKVLRVNVGETDYELATISGGSLTVGSSAISSGTGTRLLYETSGNVLGEISGATSNGTTLTLSNPSINNVSGAYATTATAAGTTTLTVADKFLQYFTGATTQTVVMPDATTLTAGMQYEIVNNSSGVVTVNKNGGTLIKAMAASTSMILTVTDISSAAGVYTTEYSTDLAIGNATATTLTATTVVATAGAGFQNMVVETSGTAASWSLPAALQITGAKFKVTIIGGGGQGGGTSTTAGQTGGGGGSGGVVVYYVTYVAGQNTMTYTVGAGGSTSTGSTTGQTGTASSIIYNSVTITASGGVGGLSGATNGAGGAGGAASGGTLNIAGFNGSSSGTMAATSNFQGDGGNTPLGFGQGGRMPSTAAGANGNPGLGYGAGGSGGRNGTGTTARNGGAGVIGVVIIEY